MARGQRMKKRLLAVLMVGTVLSVVGYGTAVAANMVSTPRGDEESPTDTSSGGVPTFTVTVHPAGNGGGVIVSDPPGIHCPSVCSADFPAGTTVTLTAQPSDGSDVDDWSGPCGAQDQCTVEVGASKTVTVTFTQVHHLVVARSGNGTVTGGHSGIHCPGRCSHAFAAGSHVTLSHHAARGWHFARWSGACTGDRGCDVQMKGDHRVVAHFAKNHS
jgi:Divergent InlB B-repeat domain